MKNNCKKKFNYNKNIKFLRNNRKELYKFKANKVLQILIGKQ